MRLIMKLYNQLFNWLIPNIFKGSCKNSFRRTNTLIKSNGFKSNLHLLTLNVHVTGEGYEGGDSSSNNNCQ